MDLLGLFGPKDVFGFKDNVEKVSEGLLAYSRFGTCAIFETKLRFFLRFHKKDESSPNVDKVSTSDITSTK